jgi:DNA polymerase-3 subunit alpha
MKTLLIRTDFSLGESSLKANRAPIVAAEKGYTSIIVADTNNIAAIIPAQQNAPEGFDVIAGVRVLLVDDVEYEHRLREEGIAKKDAPAPVRKRMYSFTILVKNDAGYGDVCELLTIANMRENFYMVPRLSIDHLAAIYARGNVIIMNSDRDSVFHRDDFVKIISALVRSGGTENFYSVVYPISTPLYDQLNSRALKVAQALKLNPVAMYPAYYESEGDADLKDVAHLVINNIKLDQDYRFRFPYQRDNGIQDRKHLLTRLKEFSIRMGVPVHPDMVTVNQDKMTEACAWRWKPMPVTLPKLADNEAKALTELAIAGLRKRLTTIQFGYKPDTKDFGIYTARLKYELETLIKLGFCGYFLMVENLISWARSNNIPTGPGRGSAAGSLVAWAIGITNIDPIRHGLLFERFINPERLDLPDVDADFSQVHRPRVLEYLESHYGEEYVAGIPNFTYLGMASALRDTGRIFGVSADDLAVSKQLKPFDDEGLSLEEAREELSALDKYAKANPKAFESATKIQSLMRGFGKHAAGVIVSGVPLTERTPVERRGDSRCIAFDKRYCEAMGLIKLDVLGLATLDLLALSRQYVKEQTGLEVDLDAIPLDDKKVLGEMAEGHTIGIFQLDGGTMRKLLKSIGGGIEPLTFESTVAVTALHRPGPMQSGMEDTYVKVAIGYQNPESIHPMIDHVTESTNGVLVYQEQIMKSAQILAGFTFAEADNIRKAIGKKDVEKMHKIGGEFVQRATEGWIEVEMDDGSVVQVQKTSMHMCSDGKRRTIYQAIDEDADIMMLDAAH